MRGTNPIRPPEQGDGSVLQVVSLFPTLQGEGPLAGVPAVFIRLGGCNLACDFCDTEFESFAPMSLDAVISRAGALACNEAGKRVRHLAVITGGEPLRQNIVPLCERLQAAGFTVQIETNGTLWRPLPEGIRVVCSPKVTNGGYHMLRRDVLERAEALKFVISLTHPSYRDVGQVGQRETGTPVYVQPMDEGDPQKNSENIRYAAQMAQRHGYQLSLQLHKMLGIQ